MDTELGFRRLIAFSDGVVAIAMTLLVLPLAELPRDLAAGANVLTVLSSARNDLIAFGVSFFVIWGLWVSHHRIFQHYRTADHVTVAANLVWLATIIVLPFPTALLSTPVAEHGATGLYVAVLLVSAVALQVLAARVRTHPDLAVADRRGRPALSAATEWANSICLALALAVALVRPGIGPWVMLLLALPPLGAAVGRRVRARRTRRAGGGRARSARAAPADRADRTRRTAQAVGQDD